MTNASFEPIEAWNVKVVFIFIIFIYYICMPCLAAALNNRDASYELVHEVLL
jgi:F0F1-type ATP synthase membrane subunit b/b'